MKDIMILFREQKFDMKRMSMQQKRLKMMQKELMTKYDIMNDRINTIANENEKLANKINDGQTMENNSSSTRDEDDRLRTSLNELQKQMNDRITTIHGQMMENSSSNTRNEDDRLRTSLNELQKELDKLKTEMVVEMKAMKDSMEGNEKRIDVVESKHKSIEHIQGGFDEKLNVVIADQSKCDEKQKIIESGFDNLKLKSEASDRKNRSRDEDRKKRLKLQETVLEEMLKNLKNEIVEIDSDDDDEGEIEDNTSSQVQEKEVAEVPKNTTSMKQTVKRKFVDNEIMDNEGKLVKGKMNEKKRCRGKKQRTEKKNYNAKEWGELIRNYESEKDRGKHGVTGFVEYFYNDRKGDIVNRRKKYNEDTIKRKYKEYKTSENNEKWIKDIETTRKPNFPEVDALLLQEYEEYKKSGSSDGFNYYERAIRINNSLEEGKKKKDFKCSRTWIQSFKARHKIED